MALEDMVGTDKFVDAFVVVWPEGGDAKSEGDDHIRGVKNCISNTFPALTGAVTLDQDEINGLPVTLAALIATMVGQIAAFAGDVLPSGWLTCDGSLQLVATYPELGAQLGDSYGGDGVTDFALPDYRGRFVRAQDAGAGRDPDTATRTDRGDGTTGDAVGTLQPHAFQEHSHDAGAQFLAGAGGGGVRDNSVGTLATGTTGDSVETRPKNVYVNMAIFHGKL